VTETWADAPEKPRLDAMRYFLRICAALIFVFGLAAYAFSIWFERRVERLVALSAEIRDLEFDALAFEREAIFDAWNGDHDEAFRRRTLAIETRFHDGEFADRAPDQVRLAICLSRALRVIDEPVRALAVLDRGTQVGGEVFAETDDIGVLLDFELESARVRLALGDPLEALDGARSVIEDADEFELHDSMLDGRRQVDARQVMGEAQFGLGDFAGAAVSFEAALDAALDAARAGVRAGVPPWSLKLHRRLADALKRCGDFEHATAERRRALEAADKFADIWHARVALPTFELGRTLANAGTSHRAEAVLALERSLISRRESACSDTRAHADHALLLARLFVGEGDVRAARTHFDDAVAILERLHELDASAIASARDALAEVTSALRAETDRQDLELGFRERADSDDSHAKVVDLNDLGRALRAQGKDREAEPYYRRALEMQLQLVAGDDRGVATLTNNVGLLRIELGEKEAGFVQLEEALAMRRRISGERDDDDVAQSLLNIASFHRNNRDFRRALQLQDEVVAILKRLRGGDDMDLALAIDNRASTLADLDRVDESIAGHLEALTMLRRLGAGDDPDVAQTLDELGAMYARVERGDDALAVLGESLRMRRRLFDSDHPKIVTTLERIGNVYWERIDAKSALPVRLEALAMRRRLWPDPDPSNARSALEVAHTHMVLDDEGAAMDVFDEVVNECTVVLPRSLWTLSEAVEGATRACAKTGAFHQIHPAVQAAGEAVSASDVPLGERRSRCFSVIGAFYAAWNTRDPSVERTAAAARFSAAAAPAGRRDR